MTAIICAIKDDMVGFGSPFLQHNDMEAERTIKTLANDKSTEIYKNAGDYSIWKLGTYDDQTGAICPIEPFLLVKAINVREVKENGI